MTHASFGRQLGTRINPIESIVPFPSSDPDDGLFNQIVWFNKPDPYSFFFPYLITMEYFENALKTPEFWRIANETWDLIVCDEMFGQPAFAFALKQQRMHGTSFIIFRYVYLHMYEITTLDSEFLTINTLKCRIKNLSL